MNISYDTRFPEYNWLPATKITYRNKEQSSKEVFFIVDLQELFGITTSFKGIKGILNKAMQVSLKYCPYDTGLMARSFTAQELDDHRIKYFFDPNKIIGKKRKGVIVKDYYPAYVAEQSIHYNFLSIMMFKFYESLFSDANKAIDSYRKKYNKPLNGNAKEFMAIMRSQYKEMKNEKKRILEIRKAQEELKKLQIENKKKELLAKKKAREAGDIK